MLAGLPGGDPLAAAVAAGQTPSPQLVADAGKVGLLWPWAGLALLAGVLAGLAGYGFYTAAGGRRVFKEGFLGDD